MLLLVIAVVVLPVHLTEIKIVLIKFVSSNFWFEINQASKKVQCDKWCSCFITLCSTAYRLANHFDDMLIIDMQDKNNM